MKTTRMYFIVAVIGTLVTCAPVLAGPRNGPVTCGRTLVGTYDLESDIDCGSGPGIIIERGVLRLRGFSVTIDGGPAVVCGSNCKLVGPGAIESRDNAIYGGGLVTISNLTIRGRGEWGVAAPRVSISESTVKGFWSVGVAAGSAKIRRSTITGHGRLEASIEDPSVAGNSRLGLYVRRGSLSEAVVSGWVVNGKCGTAKACADFGAEVRLPRRASLVRR